MTYFTPLRSFFGNYRQTDTRDLVSSEPKNFDQAISRLKLLMHSNISNNALEILEFYEDVKEKLDCILVVFPDFLEEKPKFIQEIRTLAACKQAHILYVRYPGHGIKTPTRDLSCKLSVFSRKKMALMLHEITKCLPFLAHTYEIIAEGQGIWAALHTSLLIKAHSSGHLQALTLIQPGVWDTHIQASNQRHKVRVTKNALAINIHKILSSIHRLSAQTDASISQSKSSMLQSLHKAAASLKILSRTTYALARNSQFYNKTQQLQFWNFTAHELSELAMWCFEKRKLKNINEISGLKLLVIYEGILRERAEISFQCLSQALMNQTETKWVEWHDLKEHGKLSLSKVVTNALQGHEALLRDVAAHGELYLGVMPRGCESEAITEINASQKARRR